MGGGGEEGEVRQGGKRSGNCTRRRGSKQVWWPWLSVSE
jgi:hypothetical protein